MAKFEVNGLDGLITDLADMAMLPDSVVNGMIEAGADVLVEAQKKTMAEMLRGPYSTGETARSIKKGKIRRTRSGKAITIAPQGLNQRGERNAAVAFINEYGKRGQPARPAIRTANEKYEEAAIDAAAKVYDKWLDSMGV